tara:strand:+ start:1909 stop:3159 length:1251 start_codon:yes stop_codon:yes gene_type:complete
METLTAPTTEYRFINREYELPSYKVEALNYEIGKLNKKADQLGCDRATATVIDTFQKQIENPIGSLERFDYVEYVTVSVSGEAPKLDGWSFVGYIDSEGLVYGEHIEDSERERQGECDYCGINRFRKHTFVVVHEDGTRKVVGSTCLKDFFGGKDPDGIVKLLNAVRRLFSSLDDDEFMFDSKGDFQSKAHNLTRALNMTWTVIRTYGWLSGSKAWNMGDPQQATSWIVKTHLNKPTEEQQEQFSYAWNKVKDTNNYPDSDPQLVEDAIEWAKSHRDSDKDYLVNIAIIAENGYTTNRSMGMAVSILSSYEREVNKRVRDEARKLVADASEHVGEVGKRQVFDDVTLTDLKYLESEWGVTVLHKFVADGNQLVWFGSRELDGQPQIGDTFSIKGTVKKHDEFNTIPQTIINRVKKV